MDLLLFLLVIQGVGHSSLSQGIHLSLHGVNYPNNSVVDMADIGNSSTTGLVCHTGFTNCCAGLGPDYLGSRWYYPGNRTVTSNHLRRTEAFTRTRGNMRISLHHRANAEEDPPVGIYSCAIINGTTSIILQKMYVGVYPIGKGRPSTSFITYNPLTTALTCVSSGGPASEVTWSRSGPQYQEHQQIVDTTTATYLNILTINSPELTDHTGTFSCTVSNTRGMDNTGTTIIDIGIFGSKSVYELESKVNVTCYSHLNVTSLTWRDATSNELVSENSNQRFLLLQYESLTHQMNNSRYFCQAIILLPGGKVVEKFKDFTILISKKTLLGYTPGYKSEIPAIAIGVSSLTFCFVLVITITIFKLSVMIRSRLNSASVSSKSKESKTTADAPYYETVDDLRLEEICKGKKETSTSEMARNSRKEESKVSSRVEFNIQQNVCYDSVKF